MTLSRREFLRLAGVVSAGTTLSACSPLYRRLGRADSLRIWPQATADATFALLSRLTYGPTSEERARVAENGLEAWVEEQLAPESITDMAARWRVRGLDALTFDADALEGWEKTDVIHQLKQGTLLRQVYSRRQLYENMVEFWTDHFNISIAKGECWYLKVVDDREVIRKHALGNFRDLLWASAHSPAMLIYLDNQANHKDAPNENYAREVMELHTLGVNGGYTQDDVMELARCLTGWTVKKHFWAGEFAFDPAMHDDGVKTVLEARIEPNGIGEAERVLDMLAAHPSTARYVATKLVRRFITDQPEQDAPELVERAAQAFLETAGDIKSVLRVILLDGLAGNSAAYWRPKFKRPAHFITSALRMLGADTDGGEAIYTSLGQMGQPSYEWPTPDGPPDYASAWESNLMPRWQFALGLATGELGGTSLNIGELFAASGASGADSFLDKLSELLLGIPFPAETREELLGALAGAEEELGEILLAGLVSSPAFQWR